MYIYVYINLYSECHSRYVLAGWELSDDKCQEVAADTADLLPGLPIVSTTMNLLISSRKSTPPQNRQLNISIGNSKQ